MVLDRERVFRRRRRTAFAALAIVLLFGVWGLASLLGAGEDKAASAKAAELPRGGRAILPRERVVAFYGAPQHEELGVLGIGTPEQAGAKLLRQARGYARPGRPVLPAFELISSIAHAAAGQDGFHRERQSPDVIKRYLVAARRIKALLILDVQPGQADFVDEVRALEPYLSLPDVGLALDPEWSVPAGVAPGEQIGSTSAETVNEVSAYLSFLAQSKDLPQKLLIVHQFTEGMVRDRAEIVARPGLAIVSNVDGYGTPPLKTGVYRQLTKPDVLPRAAGAAFTGFKLFYREDSGLMAPRAVLALRPQPDVVVYE